MRSTVANNQRYINPGANFMLLNGMLVEVKNFEIYSECCWAVHQPVPCPATFPLCGETCICPHTVDSLLLHNTPHLMTS
jgi:hypothetical protein